MRDNTQSAINELHTSVDPKHESGEERISSSFPNLQRDEHSWDSSPRCDATGRRHRGDDDPCDYAPSTQVHA